MRSVDQIYELLEFELGISLNRLPKDVTFRNMMKMFVQGREFSVFGAGVSGKALQQFLTSKDCKVAAFIDNDPALDGSKINAVPVYLPASLGEAGMRRYPILIASMHYHEIAYQINHEYGFASFSDYYCIHGFLVEDNIMGGGYGSDLEDHLVENLSRIIETADIWADKDSRWRYFRYIYLRLYFLTPDYIEKDLFYTERKMDAWAKGKLRECSSLPAPVGVAVGSMLSERTYEYGGDAWVGVKKGDYVIDGGAWVGDSTLSFALQVTPTGRVWAFEPDDEKSARLREHLAEVQLDEFVEVARMGLWSKKTTLNFCVSKDYHGAGSYFSEEGSNTINVTSIDAFIKKKGQHVDFIKLDIEGSELEALSGAEKTITSNWPLLAICLYHKMEDLYEIPLYLKSLGGDYRFHFKHSGLVPTDAVLFAGPFSV